MIAIRRKTAKSARGFRIHAAGRRIAAKDFETDDLPVPCGHIRSDPGVYSEISDGIA
jgi:hypothetical protein